MIADLLHADKIVIGLKGDFSAALDELLARSSLREQAAELKSSLSSGEYEHYSYIGDNIAVPHVRTESLDRPELLLGLSPAGVRLGGGIVNIILFLATPAAQTEEHLQLLQRLASLLPAVKDDLLKRRDAGGALKTIAQGERLPGKATYINLTQEQVAFELQTDLRRGLDSTEARRRLAHYGANFLRKIRSVPWYVKLMKNLFSFFAVLLWLAVVLCFFPGVDLPQLGLAILTVIVLNGLFAFLQEQKSDRAVELLQDMIHRSCRVTRDGKLVQIDAMDLVPGDLIALEGGDFVPADARLIEAADVEVDNSSLTGESAPARRYKSDRPVLIPGQFLWIESPNIVFAGTVVVRGRARAVVFGTGMHSEIGHIAGLTQAMAAEQSPLQKELRSTVFAVSGLAGGLGLACLLLGWLVGGLSFAGAFVFFIGMFVANVPEGLLPTVTLSLAMGVTRMARKHALVKSLPSVETLGCATVICCDKTGTLTQNLMMVSRVYVDGRLVAVSGAGYRPEGDFFTDHALSPEEILRWGALTRLLQCARICNNAQLEKSGSDYRPIGDPTEAALLCLAEKSGLRAPHQRLHANPFESVRKRMSVVAKLDGENDETVYVKGAPLETLERCDQILLDGGVRPLDQELRERIMSANDALAGQGLRVLALAYRGGSERRDENDWSTERIEGRLVFIGLAALSDPVRPEVPPAIRACHRAGIRVIMLTGDYPLTATTIGRQVGLGAGTPLKVFTGAEVSEMNDGALRAVLVSGEPVFARVAPDHKLRIVALLKTLGEIVAVTGDGVNDAPALKKADIGIAMGVRGNDVAKEAAHMVLADDNFGSIVAAIEEGRAIYDNVRRFMAYIFNSNPQEIYPYIFWILFPGTPLAMTVMGVLAVDIGTDLIPAMGLGIEPPESGIMERPPRDRNEKLLSVGFILRSYFVQGSILALSCYATYYYLGWSQGYWRPELGLAAMPSSPENLRLDQSSPPYLQSLTAYFFPTVTTQIANVMSKRSWKTSLFGEDFLSPARRQEILQAIGRWRPRTYDIVADTRGLGTDRTGIMSFGEWLFYPLRYALMLLSRAARRLEQPLIRPLAGHMASFLERRPVVLNWISNPLIDIGILFELTLCYLFFYTPLSRLYFLAPVPWHVYIVALHGGVLLLFFEEIKKYGRRKGCRLDCLG